MNAMEARNLTNENLNPKIHEVYNAVIEKISIAAKTGKCYIEFNDAVDTDSIGLKLHIKYMLLADGYKIVPKAELNGAWEYIDCICW